MSVTTYTVLDVRLQPLTADEIAYLTAQFIRKNERRIIANHNLHSVYIYHHDAKARKFFDSVDWVHVDGMGIVGLARLLGLPMQREHRATYVDLLPLLFAAAQEHGWKVFYLGSQPAATDRALGKLARQYPRLRISARHGHFCADKTGGDNRSVVAEINSFAPQILMVGMGMPRQENWLYDNWGDLHCNVAFCCGAALDYVAGVIPTPPRWLGQLGLEWLCRLLTEPGRLWRRYLVEPWFLFLLLCKQHLRSASHDLPLRTHPK